MIEKGGSTRHIIFDVPEGYESLIPQLTKNLTGIYREIINNPSSKVAITDSVDDICSTCPNNDGEKCKKYTRLEYLDTEAINQFGLDFGVEYPSKVIVSKMRYHANSK
ncbi:MAG: DUF1284 domain-containing protein [Candidatus Aenigmarchaeota archaeon]|nr:DUF1284 domain-containing protein [Candidatus Aenigmarchaeota archaeon]